MEFPKEVNNGLVAGSIPARPIYMHTVVPSYRWTSMCNSFIIGYERQKQYGSNVMHSEWLCGYITMVNKEMVSLISKQVAMARALGEQICSKCLGPTNFKRNVCLNCQYRRTDSVYKEKNQYWLPNSAKHWYLSASSIKQK